MHCYEERGGARACLTGNVRVGRGLERPETIPNDKNSNAEAGEGAIDNTGNTDESSDSVQTEPPDEDSTVAEVTEDPGGMAEGS